MIYTIGHSNHTIENFIAILQKHGITAIADVRSAPYSKYNPQFNKDKISASLHRTSISYVFLGKGLGARPDDPSCYHNGKVLYDKIAARQQFKEGIRRLAKGAEQYRIAIMCAEKDPIDCHRTVLVCRHLKGIIDGIFHIFADGAAIKHEDMEKRLIEATNSAPDLLDGDVDHNLQLNNAYRKREHDIAYQSNK
ncbi:MAG: DUF488 family protein [Candidatus Porifericomitaceae bacterium WSBS_2022_MAG_OTU9]